ncbi:MAG: hypothetical protein ACJ8AJ_04850 [Gemmatimonadaceae bacterium]
MRRTIVLSFFVAVGVALYACTDLSGGSVSVLSIQFDSLPVPSIVVGDTLRDTTGAVVRPVARAFNFEGEEITPSPVYFLSPDSGITVDSATGITVGDSLRSTPARIVAAVGSLQAIQRIVVTLRPDFVVAVNDRDTLQYALTDTTRDTSAVLTVKLTHGVAPNDSAVGSYIVSFAIVSQSDARLSELINEAGKASVVDTTDASGIAGRKIRLHPVYLTSTVDSIVVNATARHRGVQVAGSPVRLVVVLEPGS